MKRLLAILSVAACFTLAGCATTKNPDGTTTMPDIGAIITQVQEYCKVACGFVPTATTIANILSGGNPVVISISSISQAICAAIITPKSANRKAFVARSVRGYSVRPGYVNGVKVEGQRL